MTIKKVPLNTIVDFLNNISKTFDSLIKEHSNNRTSKIHTSTLLLFSLLYTDINQTQQQITNYINFNNNTSFDRTSITKKLNNIDINVYAKLTEYIRNFYYKTFNKKFSFIAIDGVYNNTNLLHNGSIETAMNLGLLDIDNNIILDLFFTGNEKKNNECIMLQKYIMDNLNLFKNKCIICDRAYFCYSFYNFLNKNKIKFIGRIKNNYKDISIKKYKFIRVITRHNEITKDTVNIATNCTNLSDIDICNLYSKRWNIEEYFKQLKSNYKYQVITLQSEQKLIKHHYCILIMTLLKQIIIDTYKSQTNYKEKIIKNNKGEELKTKINENNIISLIINQLLLKITNRKIDVDILKLINKNIIINYNKIGILKPRKSKIPFTKWYIKQYHEKINIINATTSHKIKQNLDESKKNLYKQFKKEILKYKKSITDLFN